MSCAISLGNLKYLQFFITTLKSCTPFLATTGILLISFLNQNFCLFRVTARFDWSGNFSTPVPWPSFRYMFIKSLNSVDSVSSMTSLGLSCRLGTFEDEGLLSAMFEDIELFLIAGKRVGIEWILSWKDVLAFSALVTIVSFFASCTASSLSSCCLSAWPDKWLEGG